MRSHRARQSQSPVVRVRVLSRSQPRHSITGSHTLNYRLSYTALQGHLRRCSALYTLQLPVVHIIPPRTTPPPPLVHWPAATWKKKILGNPKLLDPPADPHTWVTRSCRSPIMPPALPPSEAPPRPQDALKPRPKPPPSPDAPNVLQPPQVHCSPFPRPPLVLQPTAGSPQSSTACIYPQAAIAPPAPRGSGQCQPVPVGSHVPLYSIKAVDKAVDTPSSPLASFLATSLDGLLHIPTGGGCIPKWVTI